MTEVARRLNYARPGRLYYIDPDSARRLQLGTVLLPVVRGKPQITGAKAKIRKRLEHSLAQEYPVSVNHIAKSLGYANAGPIRLQFPELCRAIGEKRAALKRGRLHEVECVLKAALKEEPPRVQQN